MLRCLHASYVLQDPRFDAIVVGLGMQKRGTAGEHTEAVDDVYDISNAARLKKSEVSCYACCTFVD